MKKFFAISLTLVCALPSLACLSEAQVTRVIKSVKLDPKKKSCKAFIDLSLESQKDSYFSTFSDDEVKKSRAKLCKLNLDEIAKNGVEIGVTDDGQCPKEPGDELDAAVQKTSDSGITLKNYLSKN